MSEFGPINVVSAGAGTGKTYRLTTSYRDAVQQGMAPSRIIATTFTNKAADELLERVRERLLEDGMRQEAQLALTSLMGTVNSVCGRLVADFAIDTGLSPVVDVVPPEMAAAFFSRAAEAVLAEHAERLEPIAERLSCLDTWKETVLRIVDKARANGIAPDVLIDCARRSWDGLKPLLADPAPGVTAEDLDAALAATLAAAIGAIEGSGDETKKTREVMDQLRAAAGRLSRGQPLPWESWARLAKSSAAKASAAAVAPVIEIATQHPRHPGLHADLESLITGLFACAAAAMQSFAEFKRARGLMDFTDQEELVLDMVRRPEIRARLAERYSLLMVDEFQDTSPVQLAVFLELARSLPGSLWVGDQKQAIYGFRDTDPALVNAVVGQLAPATGGQEEVLDTSRRSRPVLVRFANAVFGAAFPPKGVPRDKVVIANIHRSDAAGQGNALHHWLLDGKKWEIAIAALAEGVAKLLADPSSMPVVPKDGDGSARPVRAGDIAVLCRGNDRCKAVADALAARGIRAAIPRDGLLSTPEALAAVAALRYLADPSDTLAVAELVALGTAEGNSGEWLQVLLRDGIDALKRIHPGIESLDRVRARLALLTPSEALEAAIATAGIDRLARGWGDGEERLANLDALRKLASGYEENCRAMRAAASAAGLVAHLAKDVENGGERPAVADDGAVRVLTYHRAKGLEWPVVILLDLDAGPKNSPFGVFSEAPAAGLDPWKPLDGRWLRFWPWPYGAQKNDVYLDATASGSVEMGRISEAEAAEMVRLLYVGVTRARDFLILAGRTKGDNAWLGMLTHADGTPVLTLPGAEGEQTVSVDEEDFAVTVSPLVAPDEGEVDDEGAAAVAWYASPPATPAAARLPARLIPSHAVVAAATAELPSVTTLGGRLPLSGDADMTLVGEAIHAFLAADDAASPSDRRLTMAAGILRRWGVSQLFPESLVEASNRLDRYARDRWGTAPRLREAPVCGRIGEQFAEGRIDLLVDGPEGWVLIDHKSFPGPTDKWAEKAAGYASQLDLYARLIEQATGRPVVERIIHMPVAGAVLRLDPLVVG